MRVRHKTRPQASTSLTDAVAAMTFCVISPCQSATAAMEFVRRSYTISTLVPKYSSLMGCLSAKVCCGEMKSQLSSLSVNLSSYFSTLVHCFVQPTFFLIVISRPIRRFLRNFVGNCRRFFADQMPFCYSINTVKR